MEFAVIEVGSTNTKAYLYKNNKITDLGFKTIEFKNHYKQEHKILEKDKEALFSYIKSIQTKPIYIFGTSIFRNLPEQEKESFLQEVKEKTSLDFTIVSSKLENELTVYGATANIDYHKKVAVMIGGGGSTELSIVQNGKIIEQANSSFGAMDTTELFPDLKENYATTNYQTMVEKTKQLVTKPKNKADILILAGGDYIYYYEELNYPVEKNKFYHSPLQPYCLDTKTMDELDKNFFYHIDLEDICKRTNQSGWWLGARGMRLCVKALVDVLETKYIIPTRISMVYGIVEKIKKDESITE